jgi:hypothetical protein
MEGWRSGMNNYFIEQGFSGFVDKFILHMTPIITQMSTVASERRDSAINQAQQVVDLLNTLGVEKDKNYKQALTEILSESLPATGAAVNNWKIDLENGAGGEGGMM